MTHDQTQALRAVVADMHNFAIDACNSITKESIRAWASQLTLLTVLESPAHDPHCCYCLVCRRLTGRGVPDGDHA
jgi:hypothetical protein